MKTTAAVKTRSFGLGQLRVIFEIGKGSRNNILTKCDCYTLPLVLCSGIRVDYSRLLEDAHVPESDMRISCPKSMRCVH